MSSTAMVRMRRQSAMRPRVSTPSRMADQIDPERKSVDLPEIVQTIELNYGSDTPFMQHTVCVAAELFNQTYLPERVGRDPAFELATGTAHDLAAVADTIRELRESEAITRARIERGELRRDVVPGTRNLKGRIEQALAQLRKVQIATTKLCDMFYPRSTPRVPFGTTLISTVAGSFAVGDPGVDLTPRRSYRVTFSK